MNSNKKQEIPEVQLEENAFLNWMRKILHADQRLKQNHKEETPRKVPIVKRTWTDVEPGEYLLSDYDISKKLIHLLRQGI